MINRFIISQIIDNLMKKIDLLQFLIEKNLENHATKDLIVK